MECRNHPATPAADRCTGCMEPFCENCLVTIRGQKYCGSCKVMALGGQTPVFEAVTELSEDAKEALKYAIIGLFCFGIILEPIAISKALKAKKMIAANPNLTGSGRATAALIIAIAGLLLWVAGILVRINAVK